MNIEEKIKVLNENKGQIEREVQQIQQSMTQFQNRLVQLQKDYLMILGKIEAYDDVIKNKEPEKDGQEKSE